MNDEWEMPCFPGINETVKGKADNARPTAFEIENMHEWARKYQQRNYGGVTMSELCPKCGGKGYLYFSNADAEPCPVCFSHRLADDRIRELEAEVKRWKSVADRLAGRLAGRLSTFPPYIHDHPEGVLLSVLEEVEAEEECNDASTGE